MFNFIKVHVIDKRDKIVKMNLNIDNICFIDESNNMVVMSDMNVQIDDESMDRLLKAIYQNESDLMYNGKLEKE